MSARMLPENQKNFDWLRKVQKEGKLGEAARASNVDARDIPMVRQLGALMHWDFTPLKERIKAEEQAKAETAKAAVPEERILGKGKAYAGRARAARTRSLLGSSEPVNVQKKTLLGG